MGDAGQDAVHLPARLHQRNVGLRAPCLQPRLRTVPHNARPALPPATEKPSRVNDPDFALRPVPRPMFLAVPGPAWALTLGDRFVAAIHDQAVAERICELINTHGLAATDSLDPNDITHHEGSP